MKKIEGKSPKKKVSATVSKIYNEELEKLFPYSSFAIKHKINFVADGCTYFFNAQHKFMQLTTVERAYFDFLCEHMNSRNKIEFKPSIRKAFVEFCKSINSGKFVRSERTLLNAEKKFVNLHLAFKDEAGAMYYMNPKHVFNGSYDKRKKLLFRLVNLATAGKIPYEVLMNAPLSVLEPSEELLDEIFELDAEINREYNEELGRHLREEEEWLKMEAQSNHASDVSTD